MAFVCYLAFENKVLFPFSRENKHLKRGALVLGAQLIRILLPNKYLRKYQSPEYVVRVLCSIHGSLSNKGHLYMRVRVYALRLSMKIDIPKMQGLARTRAD